jgi:hypothetical protein
MGYLVCSVSALTDAAKSISGNFFWVKGGSQLPQLVVVIVLSVDAVPFGEIRINA